MSSYQITDIEIKQGSVDLLRKHVRKQNGHVLGKIDHEVNWSGLLNPIADAVKNSSLDKSFDLQMIVKSLVLRELYGLGEFPFEHEVADRKSFQKFLNLGFGDVVPTNELLDEYHDYLKIDGRYDSMFDSFFKQLIDANLIPENELLVSEETNIKETTVVQDKITDEVPLLKEEVPMLKDEVKSKSPVSVDDMIAEIENRVKNLYEKKTPQEKKILEKTGIEFETKKQEAEQKAVTDNTESIEKKTADIFDKLTSLSTDIKPEITKPVESGLSEAQQKLSDQIQQFAKSEPTVKQSQQTEVEKTEDKGDLYKKLFESFYSQLKENKLVNEGQEIKVPELNLAQEQLKELETLIQTQPVETETKTENLTEEVKKVEQEISDFIEEQRVTDTGETVPVVMRPKKREINLKEKRKLPIFNDANLTEDYELGLRFFKLGFKTSFVNLKTDKENGNTRIATGEYFPNTFWGAVKQRSRWLAGIVFQNWKIHGWKGSAKTKYFLLRDRKSIISFFGTALSYLCLAYFLVYTITLSLGYTSPLLKPIVGTTSPLWYLMLAATFFMVVRIFHRFAFTYNWYGLRYAIMSIFRMVIDNVVNLFAMIRAVKVFRQTKDKVVWDSTEHY
ncbi:MAG TPA: glycosyltransferase family 2 protein [Ignavibacteria bacterium]|nr:glycosyltransferase family 2 protein [Ignavibacteria bacterium]